MYSCLQRANQVVSLATTALFALLFAISVSSYFLTLTGPFEAAKIDVQSLNVVMGKSRSVWNQEVEYGFVRFDLKADLRPLFHWNTKQIFLQLNAEYTTPNNSSNSVVLWDKIIQSPRKARLNIQGGRNTFTFKEASNSFKDSTDLTYSLNYHIMPYVGFLQSGEVTRSTEASNTFPKPKKNL
ncbi:Signal peptidase complex subunit [Phaffia rhodozyma]|uniref:Signal peptidase subunit 3 n=1 Tax=Phaffia rhodozyma TaxID=264483 RepID=A0A0F7SYD0_PHARH|nr:Signal peptidase complex subunit [Phaffia rhodozyma]